MTGFAVLGISVPRSLPCPGKRQTNKKNTQRGNSLPKLENSWSRWGRNRLAISDGYTFPPETVFSFYSERICWWIYVTIIQEGFANEFLWLESFMKKFIIRRDINNYWSIYVIHVLIWIIYEHSCWHNPRLHHVEVRVYSSPHVGL